jgi:hypothetical protein
VSEVEKNEESVAEQAEGDPTYLGNKYQTFIES